MQIIGFNFEKISADRKKNMQGKIEISSNINIKTIEHEKIDMIKDQTSLKFAFDFTIDYKPDLASLSLQGTTILLFDKERAKDILKKWKNKKIAEDIRLPLFNFIMTKCNLRALQLEEELNLPPHLPLPKIQPQQQNTNYAG